MCRGRPPISCASSPRARQRAEVVVARQLRDLLGDAVRVALGDPRQPFELGERQAERLAEVADRPARVVRRERGDERGVLVPVALCDRDDQLLADVAREVEVDIRSRGKLPVEEAPEREVGLDRIDVREAGQVADDRADRASAPAPGRQRVPRRSTPAHLERDVLRKLEHLPVEQEEAGELELGDEGELLVEPPPRLSL